MPTARGSFEDQGLAVVCAQERVVGGRNADARTELVLDLVRQMVPASEEMSSDSVTRR
ncbi:hypothetical protein [Rhodococcus sp. SMB37]|uniref:hypothetical protein n=1 Tax=Rhodococcus sp. SMB37 TaxID=2512213 RepID=UPI0013052E88|nr:hypothetical protein [Rhodococcus sp. SMB37]